MSAPVARGVVAVFFLILKIRWLLFYPVIRFLIWCDYVVVCLVTSCERRLHVQMAHVCIIVLGINGGLIECGEAS